jgi:hypothetical protein
LQAILRKVSGRQPHATQLACCAVHRPRR